MALLMNGFNYRPAMQDDWPGYPWPGPTPQMYANNGLNTVPNTALSPSYQSATQSLTPPVINKDKGNGFGFDLPTFNMIGAGLGGIGQLASGWAALKNLGLAKDQLGFQQDAFTKNMAMQERAYGDNVRQVNNDIRARQDFIAKTHANPDFSHLKTLNVR